MSKQTTVSRFRLGGKMTSLLLSAAMVTSAFTGLGANVLSTPVEAASDYGLLDNVGEGLILHAWNWSFNAIKDNMQAIAEAGYTSVQTSPVQRPKDASPGTSQWDWWKVYQPTSICFSPGGHAWFGSKDDFRAMCNEADKYGIKVIVDVVANHMANSTGGYGNTRADICSQNDPTFRDDDSCWHLNGSRGINYGQQNRYGGTDSLTYGFGGWPDLNTGNKKVQNAVIDLLKECYDLGADGFRFDAAKHIELPTDPGGATDFWPTVIGGIENYAKSKGGTVYCYGEILDDSATDIKNYTKYIAVTDNRAGNNIRFGIRNGNVEQAANSALYYNGVPANKIVLWAESHDTYANDDYTGDSTRDSQDQVNRAWCITASRQFPALYFIRPDNPRQQKMGQASSNTSWKSKEIAEVNKFHNAFVGQSEYMSSSGDNVLVERGAEGVVIVNIRGNSQSVNATVHKMKDGTYKDQVSGNTFTVSGGRISGQLGSKGISVVYNAKDIIKGNVSASPSTGTSFTDTLSVTLHAKDVSNASYTTSEGASGSYTDGQTITVGASTDVGGSVKVSLSGKKSDGSPASADYTYIKKDPNARVMVYFDNSGYHWKNVYAYIYNGSGGNDDPPIHVDPPVTSEICLTDNLGWGTVNAYFFNSNGTCGSAWPGTAMTYYETNPFGKPNLKISIPSGATHVVFNNGYGTQTKDLSLSGVTGYYLDGSPDNAKPWDASAMKSTSTSAATVQENSAWPGVQMTLNASTGLYELEVPDNLVNGKVIFTESKDAVTNRYPADQMEGLSIGGVSMKLSAGNKWEPYISTKPVTKDPQVTVDKASGTSFTTEEFDITLSLSNATKGTYSVDNGPVKEFTSATKVTIGEGKIGDSAITVKTTATNGSKTVDQTFTYNKKYVVKTSATSATSANSKYATNPNGNVGAKKTITSAKDFTAETLIAQGVANDDPAAFRGTHEAPKFDLYALYAAWDDTNLYVGIQYTNVIDVVDSVQQSPQTGRGKPNGADANIPQMLLFDTKTGDYTDGSTNDTKQKTVWDTNVTFAGDTKVDKILMYSPQVGIDNYAVFSVTGGKIDYPNAVFPGYQKPLAGASITWEDGFFCSTMNGINDNGNAGYTPADLESSSGKWVDFLTTNHSTSQDTFCIITLPLKYLGVSANDIASKGIGLMAVATYGASGIGCLPHDTVMLDHAKEEYSAGDNTSKEKEDVDQITIPLAGVGKGGTQPTPPTPPVGTPLQVNFGTDRSAPQASDTALTIKGIGYGGTAPYKYEFSADNRVIKASSSTDSVAWTPTTKGQHTLKCVITDATGKSVTETKTFTSEGGGEIIPPDELVNESAISAKTIRLGSAVTVSGAASGGTAPYQYAVYYKKTTDSKWVTAQDFKTNANVSFIPAKAATYNVVSKVKDTAGNVARKSFTVTVQGSPLVNKTTLSSNSVVIGKSITVKGAASGGTSPYKYAVYYKKTTDSQWVTVQDFKTNANVSITPARVATYKVVSKVKDANGTVERKEFTLTFSSPLTNKSALSATTVSLGSSVTVKNAASGGTTPYKYAVYYKKSTDSQWVTAQNFTKATTATFTPAKAATYKVVSKVKDAKGTVERKEFTLTVNKPLTNKSTLSASSVKLGSAVTVKGAASGGSGFYNFAVFYKRNSQSQWTTVQNYKSNSSVTIKPAAATSYKVCVKVRDSKGTVEKKYLNLSVTKAVLANTSKLSASSIAFGKTVTVKASATGGTAPYKYAVYYKKTTDKKWVTKQNFSSNTSVAIKPTMSASYTVCVKVKDAKGSVEKKYLTVKADGGTLVNTSSLSASSVKKGTKVTVRCTSQGGAGPYKYAVYYKKTTDSQWVTAQNFSYNANVSVKPALKASYQVRIKVKDQTGKVMTKTLSLTSK